MSNDARYELTVSFDRARAIEDGVLVDVTRAAVLAGHPYPVALTREAWERAVAGTDEPARLKAVLVGLTEHVTRHGFASTRVEFRVGTARLVARYGPGDDGRPVITIKAPWERD